MKPFISIFSIGLLVLLISGCEVPSNPQTQDNIQKTEVQNKDITETTITKAGTYTFSGKTDPITISATKEDDIEIILDNVEITSDSRTPIYILEAKDVTITLAKNSVNTITDNRTAKEEVEDLPNAAIYSMSDLKITGKKNSMLEVTGNFKDGVRSKDDLKFKEVSIKVNAKNNGILGKDSVKIKEADITVTTKEGDAIKSDNETNENKGFITIENSTLTIDAKDDGIRAVRFLEITESDIDILNSFEGLESLKIDIYSGNINITASDDGINIANTLKTEEEKAEKEKENSHPPTGQRGQKNADDEDHPSNNQDSFNDQPGNRGFPPGLDMPDNWDTMTEEERRAFIDANRPSGGPGGGGDMFAILEGGELNIHGGNITINSGGDGIDSNANAVIISGTLTVTGAGSGPDSAIDVNGEFFIEGGTVLGIGTSEMAHAPSTESTQYSIHINLEDYKKAGTVITLKDDSGREVFNFTTEKDFQAVTYSSKNLQKGQEYTFYLDDEKYADITLETIVTQHGENKRRGSSGGSGIDFSPNMKLPDNWENMTESERHEYMENNRPEIPQNFERNSN